MTKQKIFFIVLGILLFGGLAYFLMSLNAGQTNNTTTTNSSDFKIWVIQDDAAKFQEFLTGFKEAYPDYAQNNIIVESFSEKQSYYSSLISALLAGTGPDLFVLENSEISPFENQIRAIDPAKIAPSDFRIRFKPVFGDDLIFTDELDPTKEYLKGVPMGYEALGLYYNRKYFLRPSDMETWEDLLTEVKNISEKYSEVVALALGNGSAVTRSVASITSFFVLEGAKGLQDISPSQSQQALTLYTAFAQESGGNNYNRLSKPFLGETDIDFFTQGDAAAMLGYPRDLLEIDKVGYQKSFLFVSPIPAYAGKEKKTAIRYNYFAINKQTSYPNMTTNLLAYMASSQGQQKYIDTFPYYLPAETSVEKNVAEKKILPQYNIVYSNFIDPRETLVSFNEGDTLYYENEMQGILDLEGEHENQFQKMSAFIVCSSTKQQTLLNLSSPCK